MADFGVIPAVPIGYWTHLKKLGRDLDGDPLCNCLFAIRVEDIADTILCTRIEAPETTIETYTIRQNNSLFAQQVPISVTMGTLKIYKVIHAGVTQGKNVTTAFSDWVKQVKDCRENTPSTSYYRRNITIYLLNNADVVSAQWEATNCFPVSYSAFENLDTANVVLATESITFSCEAFSRQDV